MEKLIKTVEKIAFVGIVGFAVYLMATKKPEKVQPLNDPWFTSHVTEEMAPVLVKFGATWCGPCRMMDQVLDEYSHHNDGRVRVVRVDIDQRPDLAEHFHVGPIPRLILFHRGEVLASTTGSRDLTALNEWVNSHLQ